jgi:hypothetical protein
MTLSELSFEEKIPIQMLKYAYGYETIIKDKIPIEMSMQIASVLQNPSLN